MVWVSGFRVYLALGVWDLLRGPRIKDPTIPKPSQIVTVSKAILLDMFGVQVAVWR